MPAPTARWDRVADRNAAVRFVDIVLRGAGQVMFQGNPLTGLLFLAGIWWGAVVSGTAAVAVGAVLGLVVATVTAQLLNPDPGSLRSGLYGFNGILVGAALPTFLDGGPVLWVYLVLGAAMSTVVFMAVSKVFETWHVPALTFPFNLVTWVLLLAAFQFVRVAPGSLPAGQLPRHIGAVAADADITIGYLWNTLFRNISQVFLINDTVTGLVFLAGLAVASGWAALFAVIGSATATAAVLALGADAVDVGNGLYGLSAVLTAVALGSVFYRPTWRVLAYTLLGVWVTVAFHAALVSAFAPFGLPAGTGAFVAATWLFLLPKKQFVPVQHDTIAGGAAEGGAARHR